LIINITFAGGNNNEWQRNLTRTRQSISKALLMSEIIQSEALINLLDRKGIISKQELLEEMRRVQENCDAKSGAYLV